MKSNVLLLALYCMASMFAVCQQQATAETPPGTILVGNSLDDLKQVELTDPPLMGNAFLHLQSAFANQVIILERNGVSYAFTERDRRHGFYYIGLKSGDRLYLAPQNETIPKLQQRIDNLKLGGEMLTNPDQDGELEIIDFVPKIKWTLTESTPSPKPENIQSTPPPSPTISHNDQGNSEASVTPFLAQEAEVADPVDRMRWWPFLLAVGVALAAVFLMIKALCPRD